MWCCVTMGNKVKILTRCLDGISRDEVPVCCLQSLLLQAIRVNRSSSAKCLVAHRAILHGGLTFARSTTGRFTDFCKFRPISCLFEGQMFRKRNSKSLKEFSQYSCQNFHLVCQSSLQALSRYDDDFAVLSWSSELLDNYPDIGEFVLETGPLHLNYSDKYCLVLLYLALSLNLDGFDMLMRIKTAPFLSLTLYTEQVVLVRQVSCQANTQHGACQGCCTFRNKHSLHCTCFTCCR